MSFIWKMSKYCLPFGMLIMLVVMTLNPLPSPTVRAQDPSVSKIESDDPAVMRTGTWSSQASSQASGGSYLYNAPSPIHGDDVALSLQFSGPTIEILYVSGPNLGTMALEIDGVVLRTVITTNSQTAYQQSATIDYLTDEAHTLRVYAQAGGVIGVDAFRVALQLQSVNHETPRVSPPCNESAYLRRINETTDGTELFDWNGYNGYPYYIHLSDDGRYTSFETGATGYVPENAGLRWVGFIYRLDNVTCEFRLVTSYADGTAGSMYPYENWVMSSNGRYFVFSTELPLSPIDTDTQFDLYVRDMETNSIIPITLGQANVFSGPYAEHTYVRGISRDGRFILFYSDATNIVPGDINIYDADMFVYDMQAQTYELVSTGNGYNETRSYAIFGAISNDGRYVVFNGDTSAGIGDANELFLRDRQLQTTTLITHSDDGTPLIQNFSFVNIPKFSEDGQQVSYLSSRCVDLVGSISACRHVGWDASYVFIYNLATGENSLALPFPLYNGGYNWVGQHDYVAPYSMSPNFRYVVGSLPVNPQVSDYPPRDYEIRIYDRETATLELVTIPFSNIFSQEISREAVVSNDGRWVAFSTRNPNLLTVVDQDRWQPDLLLADRFATRPHTALSAILINYGRIKLTWRQISATSTNFEVERSADGESVWAVVSTTGMGDTAYQDSGLACDTNYSYRLRVLTPQTYYAQTSNVVTVRTSPCDTDRLVIINPSTRHIALFNTMADPVPSGAVTTYTLNARASGQWVMGDWDGDGVRTPGVYEASGAFMYTNTLGPTATWTGIWFGLLGRPPIAGHFDASVNHDCLGVMDSGEFPPYGTGYAAYFACDLTSGTMPHLYVQWLGVPYFSDTATHGAIQVVAGDIDGDGVDSFGWRRDSSLIYTDQPPSSLVQGYTNSTRFWTPLLPANEYGLLVLGDWNDDGHDKIGFLSQTGEFAYQSDRSWLALVFLQHIGTPIGTPVQAFSWR